MTEQQRGKRPTWRTLNRVRKVAAGLGALLAGLATFAAVMLGDFPRQLPSDPSPTAAFTVQTAAPSGGRNPPLTSDCVDGDGNRVPCRYPGSRLVVNPLGLCSESSAIALLGIDGDMQLNVKAETIGGLCTLAPGAIASAAGATADDIKELAKTGGGSKLAVCYADADGTEVSCSNPHWYEAVSVWISDDETDSERTARCEAIARNYVDRTFEGSEPLKLMILQSSDSVSYRCAIGSPMALQESLWKIGGRQLPR